MTDTVTALASQLVGDKRSLAVDEVVSAPTRQCTAPTLPAMSSALYVLAMCLSVVGSQSSASMPLVTPGKGKGARGPGREDERRDGAQMGGH